MRKWFGLPFLLLLGLQSANAQYLNIQHHLDFGKNRHYFTNTLEGLAFDDLGAWFGFIDVDHKSSLNGTAEKEWQIGAQFIYFELNRYFSLNNILKNETLKNWDFTVQYNDSDADFIPYAYLIGFSWNQRFTSFIDAHVEFLFRQEENQKAGWQLTGVWLKSWKMAGLDWQFLGYFDWWKNDYGGFFMAEPQFVFNLEPIGTGKRFWSGTEWEINLSKVSGYTSTNPTIFLRYDF